MRILHIGKYFPPDPGGMEVFLADLVGAQRAAGDESFALVHGEARSDDPEWLMRVPVAMQLVYTPISPAFRATLARAIRRFEPDVLHLHMPNPSVFWALTLASARERPWVVHWQSDVLATKKLSVLSLAYSGFYRFFEEAVLAQAQRIIVTSPDYLDASRPLRPWRDKCAVIPLGLDLSRMTASNALSSGVPAWPDGKMRVLSIGRLAHYKGFHTLIEVAEGLPGVHVLIAGSGEWRAQLAERIARIEQQGRSANVTLCGAVDEDEKRRLLETCDVFCLASCERTESFGIAVLEAMAHGKPCIVSDVRGSGLPWLVRSSGAGITVPVGDVDAWRAAIDLIRADVESARRFGDCARAALVTHFDCQAVARRVRACYPLPEIAPVREIGQPLVVIPARDEAATIAGVIRAVLDQGLEHIVVIDDQSVDGTAELARKAGATVLTPVLSMGAWGAMQTGIRYAMRNGFAQVITLDADGQHEPAYIPQMRRAAESCDVVIGAYPERGSTARRIAWRYFRAITGFRVEDLTSGFRCYNRIACEVLAEPEATLLDYQDLGVLLMLRNAGLTITEIPVAMYPRAVGPSRIFASWLRVGRYMFESTLLCLARWHPKHHFRQ